jgi:hypothetical protein
MSRTPNPQEQATARAATPKDSVKRSRSWAFLAIGVPFVALVVFALLREVGEGPVRRLRGELPGYGPILVALHLTPDPPRTGSTGVHVQVDEIAGAAVRGVAVAITTGSDAGPRERIALVPAGAGGHQGTVTFPSAGRWWIDVEVARGRETTRVRFLVDVQML